MTELVYDIGMGDGDDSLFYLLKGFRVVAVEADPSLCDAARVRLWAFIEKGQLTIVNRAVVAKAVDPLIQPFDRVGPGAQIEALLPAVDPETRSRELPPKREGGLVAAQEPGDDQHRLPVERPTRPAFAEGAEHPPEVPRDFAPVAVLRRGIVAFPMLRVAIQRNSRPISCCMALGSRTRPSAIWWFSNNGTRILGDASAVLLSVCAKRTFPSDPRYRMFARRACQSCSVEQLCVSRYLPSDGTQLSMSFMRYLPRPMSPVDVSITW